MLNAVESSWSKARFLTTNLRLRRVDSRFRGNDKSKDVGPYFKSTDLDPLPRDGGASIVPRPPEAGTDLRVVFVAYGYVTINLSFPV